MRGFSRRSFIAATAVAIAAPQTVRAANQPDLSNLYAKAKDEGQLSWYVVYLPSDLAEQYAAAFMAAYPGIKVSPIRLTAQVAYQRLNQDIKAGIPNCDVFASTDLGHFVSLKKRGLLLQYRPQNTQFIDKMFQDIDSDNMFQTISANTVTLLYNTNKVKGDRLPSSWKDLTDPIWRNQVSVGHPGYSGFVGTWVVQMEQMYGWKYFENLANNRPQIGRSIIDTITNVVSGERSIAAGPSSHARLEASRGNPIGVASPTDGEILMLTPSAIMANSRHPNAAKLFTEWLYGREAAELIASHYDIPLRSDVRLKPGVPSIQTIKTIRPTNDQIIKNIPLVIEKWRDTFGV